MINRNGWIVLAILGGLALILMFSCGARAEGYSCADVRAAVATIKAGSSCSQKRAVEILEAMAKGSGAKPEQIAIAKRCLPSSGR